MRAIDADALREDCKRYLGTLNPDRDGKECTRIHWLIGVLENAPTIEPEPCEDAVSRTELLRIFEENCYPVHYDHNSIDVGMTLPGIVEVLNIATSVTPKRKTGKWIEEQRGIKVTQYKCSECGRAVIDDTGYDVAKDFPFCHCGADMRGEQE